MIFQANEDDSAREMTLEHGRVHSMEVAYTIDNVGHDARLEQCSHCSSLSMQHDCRNFLVFFQLSGMVDDINVSGHHVRIRAGRRHYSQELVCTTSCLGHDQCRHTDDWINHKLFLKSCDSSYRAGSPLELF